MTFTVTFHFRLCFVFAVFLSDQFFVDLVAKIDNYFKTGLQNKREEKYYGDKT